MNYLIKLSQISIYYFAAFIFFQINSLAQEEKHYSSIHNEKPDHEYVKSKPHRQYSLPFEFKSKKISVTQVNVNENGMTILGDAANEPSIAIDFKNPNKMAIGWRQFDHVTSNFRQAGYAFTKDGGKTWTFPGVLEPGVFRSDPVLDSDAEGNFYYLSLHSASGNYSCQLFRSTDGGETWGVATDAKGGDKPWLAIDRSQSPGKGHIYSYWNGTYSSCQWKGFTRSVDGGNSFDECTGIPFRPYWGTMTVGLNGDLFLTGYDGVYFSVWKSTNAKYADSVVTFNVPNSIYEMNGRMPSPGGPNPVGIVGQANVGIDTSHGRYHNNLYVLATIRDLGSQDPAEIYVVRSSDGGDSWSQRSRVNDDNSDNNYQWFGTLSVAPNGRIDAVWLDTRNSPPGKYESELFYSFSTDGGYSWFPNVNLLEQSFDPHVGWPQQNKMGDYFDMISDNEGVHLAWAATFGGEQNVYYSRIFTDVISGLKEAEIIPKEFVLHQNYPNPFNPTTKIKYQVASIENVSLKVYDVLGREIKTLINKPQQPGEYEIEFNAENFSSGVYFYTLRAGNLIETKKMLLAK